MNAKINPEVINWAQAFFNDNKEIMHLFNINSPEELLKRLLNIPKQP